MQSESSLPQEPKAAKKLNLSTIFLVILLIALAGVGYWAFSLNTTLKATQSELTTLKGDYANLTTEKNKLSSNLDQTTAELETTKAELETTKAELTTAQADLSKANSEVTSLKATIKKAWLFAEVARGLFVEDDNNIQAGLRILATGDATLKSKFEAIKTQDDFNTFLDYLFNTLSNMLK